MTDLADYFSRLDIDSDDERWLIPEMPVDYFSFESWRRCDIFGALGIACRKDDIVSAAEGIRKYAVGYLPPGHLWVRPRAGEYAVMFLVGEAMGWTHLRADEFEEVFRVG